MYALSPQGRRLTLVSLALGGCSNDIAISDELAYPPAVTIRAPLEGELFSELDAIEFVGGVEDPNGPSDLVSLEWTSDLDGVLATLEDAGPDRDGTTRFAATLSPGAHAITLTAVDGAALSAATSVSVVVELADYLPSAEITVPAAFASFQPGEPIQLIGSVDDPNQSQETLSASWQWQPEEGGDRATLSSPTPTASGSVVSEWTDAPIGRHRLFLAVVDDDGNRVEDQVVIEVEDPNAGDLDLDGWTVLQGDCDDSDPEASPDRDEVCDGRDNDCNGIVDDKDLDGDRHVDELCVGYLDLLLPRDDCDDADGTVFFGASEQGDGKDNDCDGAIDDGLSAFDNDGDCFCTATSCTGSVNPGCASLAPGDCDDTDPGLNPLDLDGDGGSTCQGDCDDTDTVLSAADLDGDGSSSCAGDCDDADPALNPEDLDNDGASSCAGDCDDADAQQNVIDADSDGASTCQGDCNDGSAALNLLDLDGDGFASCLGDCDDLDPDKTSSDGDGDGLSSCGGDCDDADPALNQIDQEGDGYTTCGGDCDDADPALNPGDLDSDGTSSCQGDCDDLSAALNLDDIDRDGVSSCGGDCDDLSAALNLDDVDADGASTCAGDCDDADPLANVDDADGDGFSTCEEDCDDSDGSLTPEDRDGDRISSCEGDCSDADATVFPGALEIPYNGQDDNCLDGDLRDVDGDGRDAAAVGGSDCDDSDADVFPGAAEACNGVDDDCDTRTDEDGAIGCSRYYHDGDRDGYGTSAARCQCAPQPGSGYDAVVNGDCYDSNPDAHPGQTSYFFDDRGDGSWDYNCDNVQSKLDNRTAAYECEDIVIVFPPGIDCEYTNGWETPGNPSCGDTKNYGTGCFYAPLLFCEPLTLTPVDQKCR